LSSDVSVYKFANRREGELDISDFLDAIGHVSAIRIQEEFNNQAFGARRRSAGLIFKQLVEATLSHRGWKVNQEFFNRKVPNLRPSSFSFGKEVNGLRVAASWGFGNAIGITSIVLSPIYTRNSSQLIAWHPDYHIIIVGSSEFNKALGIDAASATSQQYLTTLKTLEAELPTPTVLISLEHFVGLKVIETSGPQRVTSVELTQ
jgi:hypothetical protein